MNVLDSIKLMAKYAKCPKCGSEAVGSGKGTLDCNTEKGYFKRTCACGWSVEINEQERGGESAAD